MNVSNISAPNENIMKGKCTEELRVRVYCWLNVLFILLCIKESLGVKDLEYLKHGKGLSDSVVAIFNETPIDCKR